MANVLIGLGSNLGSREENLRRALQFLDDTPGIDVRAVSRWVPTRPIGGPAGQPDFLNGAALLQTSLSPEHLLHRVQEIEGQLGRVRTERWGPRPLDLDILLYEQLVVESPRLRIPHPAMPWRRFVLEPAAQVAGWMPHPQIGWTVRELFEHLRLAFPYVAITGPYPALNRRLAQRVAQQTGADLVCVPFWLKMGLRRLAEKAKTFSEPLKQGAAASLDSEGSDSSSPKPGGPALASPLTKPDGTVQPSEKTCPSPPEERPGGPLAKPGEGEQGARTSRRQLSPLPSPRGGFLKSHLGEGELDSCLRREDKVPHSAEMLPLNLGVSSTLLEDAPREEIAQPTQLAQDIVQWLHVLTERLPSYRYRQPLDGWVVSDFWLPQWLAEAAALLEPVLSEADRRLWESLLRLIAFPKLLVLLDREGDDNPNRTGSAPSYLEDQYHRLGWQGPVLRIRLAREIWPPRLTRAAAEVQTAMQGME